MEEPELLLIYTDKAADTGAVDFYLGTTADYV